MPVTKETLERINKLLDDDACPPTIDRSDPR